MLTIVAIVLAIAAIYGFGWVCYNQGYYDGFQDGIKPSSGSCPKKKEEEELNSEIEELFLSDLEELFLEEQ